ncbi:extracellular solute-binding protein [Ancylobacter amanitiformis]|uniref:Spermidine/putrescine transport system substrate-binding protein n=1 Tax=Ancylobacter amanitiformis TaxID=217069 RepID=A0ABU0LPB1_9HYPH|nr:extracellular solute-binding protein [Ancylobacter amanitiformis]MDQ0510544.1 spermidine/putrescine transport system substrate-binding protein [Ancylobacter amanitiformis]
MSRISTSGLTRRSLLKGTAAAGAALVAAPAFVKSALASSGELNFLGWAGYDQFPAVFAEFEKKTGIKVKFTGLGSQDEFVAQAKTGAATNGAFDISEPTADRLASWTDNDFIQPWDEKKANAAGIEPAFLEGMAGEMTSMGGKRISLPSVWGTEALTFNTDDVKLEYGKAKLMDLFDNAYAGKLTLRGHSGLVAAGRALDAEGKLPHKFLDSYKDESKMIANYDAILKFLAPKRGNVAQFWSNENEAQGAFRTNGCVIGHCWDTSAAALQAEKFPVAYLAPAEGAMSWLQNFVLLKGAKNVDQAYAWVSWVNSPEGSALWAKAFGSNPCAKGAVELADASQKAFLKAAYPGDALKKLWWQPGQASWFVTRRTEYAKKFMSA